MTRLLRTLSLSLALAWFGSTIPGAAHGVETPETVERVKPSIVAVGTFQRTRSPAFRFAGTGFAVGDGTLVATNSHVVPVVVERDQRETLVVRIPGRGGRGDQIREATTVAVDKQHDLAVLRIQGAPLPALTLRRDMSNVREGEIYTFTGFPIGGILGFSPVTHRAMISSITPIALPTASTAQLNEHVVSRVRRGVFPIFQLDATVYPGNSGSPLYHPASGEVIGIINMTFVKESKESGLTQPSGISFAIPVEHLQELLRRDRTQ